MFGGTRIRAYQAGDASAIVRLFYETVRSVNRADYSDEQVRAWAPSVPDPNGWHARMAGRLILRRSRQAWGGGIMLVVERLARLCEGSHHEEEGG
jgi:hypothetical protein